jgi:hypothetical protein
MDVSTSHCVLFGDPQASIGDGGRRVGHGTTREVIVKPNHDLVAHVRHNIVPDEMALAVAARARNDLPRLVCPRDR